MRFSYHSEPSSDSGRYHGKRIYLKEIATGSRGLSYLEASGATVHIKDSLRSPPLSFRYKPKPEPRWTSPRAMSDDDRGRAIAEIERICEESQMELECVIIETPEGAAPPSSSRFPVASATISVCYSWDTSTVYIAEIPSNEQGGEQKYIEAFGGTFYIKDCLKRPPLSFEFTDLPRPRWISPCPMSPKERSTTIAEIRHLCARSPQGLECVLTGTCNVDEESPDSIWTLLSVLWKHCCVSSS